MSEVHARLRAMADSIEMGPEFEGFHALVTGGAVRDVARGVSLSEVEDIDLLVFSEGDIVEQESVLRDRMRAIDPADAHPVFWDSKRRDVTLPRTERSTGDGHAAAESAVVDADRSLAEAVRIDMARRDLTVNAFAVDVRTGEIFDPFGGLDDLENGVLRHVSEAFTEDPLRVVRLARFVARLDGHAPEETMALAEQTAPKLRAVPIERITMEARKMFKQSPSPSAFFRVLHGANAIRFTFPSLGGLPVQALHRVHDSVRAMAAVGGHNPRLGFGAVAMGLDDARREILLDVQDLHNDEQRAIQEAVRLAPRLVTLAEADAEAVVGVAEDLHRPGGLAPHEAFMAAQAHARAFDSPFPEATVARRLRVAVQAVERVSGERVINRENVRPGEDIDGAAFGQLLRRHRAGFVRARV